MPLTYQPAKSIEDALALLGAGGSRVIAGGTDLLVAMEAGLDSASVVVDITKAPALAQVVKHPHGGVRLGAAMRLDALAVHAMIRSHFPALGLAAESVATPAIRQRASTPVAEILDVTSSRIDF